MLIMVNMNWKYLFLILLKFEWYQFFFNGRIKTNYFWPFFQFFWTPFWPTSHVFRRMTLWGLIGLYKTSKLILMTHRSGSTCWPWKIEKTSKTSKSVNQLNSNTFEKKFLRKKISDFHNFFKKKLILPKLCKFECS